MPPSASQPVCGQCGTKNSTIWHKTDPDDPLNSPLCSACHAHHAAGGLSGGATGTGATSGHQSSRVAIPADGDRESSQEPDLSNPSLSITNSVVEMIRAESAQALNDLSERRSRDRTPEFGHSSYPRERGRDKKEPIRKNTRSRGKQMSAKFTSTKGKSRRIIFKNRPLKGPTSFATPATSDHLFHRGSYFQVGDIVRIIDEDDRLPYYAQLEGFLTDQYCVKSATIAWLLPVRELSADRWTFNPRDFFLGPSEEFPRLLDCMEFVMHAPADYYRPLAAPYPVARPSSTPETLLHESLAARKLQRGFVWTRLGPRIVSRDEWESQDWEPLPSHPIGTVGNSESTESGRPTSQKHTSDRPSVMVSDRKTPTDEVEEEEEEERIEPENIQSAPQPMET